MTGVPSSAEHPLKIGERVYNLERHYNNLNGFREGSDYLPERFKEPSTYGGSKGHVCELDQILLGVHSIRDLAEWNPEQLYARLRELTGHEQDPCVLYTFRCAIYAARTPNPEQELLKWWNGKDRTLEAVT